MKLNESLQIMQILYNKPEDLLLILEKYNEQPKLFLLYRLHLPLFILLIPFMTFSPFALYHALHSVQYFFLPFLVLAISTAISCSHDYVIYFFGSPVTERPKHTLTHFSMISQLSIATSFPFFFLHPNIGLIFLIISFGYAQLIAIDLHARYHQRTHAMMIGHIFMGISILLIPIVALLFILNVWDTVIYLLDIFIL